MDTLRIKLLGEFSACFGGGEPLPIKGRKAQALLAILALSPGRLVQREKLTSLLWSDRGDEQARGSLRQALAELRKALNDEDGLYLIADRDNISLNSKNTECDAVKLESLSSCGSDEDAASLYGGEFLDSIGITDPAFEEWISETRSRFRELAQSAIGQLLEQQTEAGMIDKGILTARKLLSIDPLQEKVHRSLMQLYSDQGDRSMAIKQYQACRDVLKAELNVDPETATEKLFLEVRGGIAEAEISTEFHEEQTLPERTLPDKPSIAVLPFINMSGDAEQEYFADGITGDLITALSKYRFLFVIARTSSFRYKGVPIDVRVIGEELGVRYIVEGSVRKVGNRVRISVQLIEAPTGNNLWAERYDRELEDIFLVQDEITSTVTSAVGGHIYVDSRRRAMKGLNDFVEAYDLTLRASSYIFTFNKEDNFRAEKLLYRALELDPENAESHARLSSALLFQWLSFWKEDRNDIMQRAYNHGHIAVELDENDSRTRWAFGEVQHYRGEFEDARYHLEAAIKINPNDVESLTVYATYMFCCGEVDRALKLFDGIARLDPFATNWRYWMNGIAYFTAGRYEEAISILTKISDPNVEIKAWLAASYGHAGQIEKANEALANFLNKAETDMVVFPGRKLENWTEFVNAMGYQDQKDSNHFLDGLHKAGLAI